MNILKRFPLLILLFALSLFSGAHVATAANVTGKNVTEITTNYGDVFSKVKNSRWVLTNSSGEITQKYTLKKRSYRWVTLDHRTDDVSLKFDTVDGFIYKYTNNGNDRDTLAPRIIKVVVK